MDPVFWWDVSWPRCHARLGNAEPFLLPSVRSSWSSISVAKPLHTRTLRTRNLAHTQPRARATSHTRNLEHTQPRTHTTAHTRNRAYTQPRTRAHCAHATSCTHRPSHLAHCVYYAQMHTLHTTHTNTAFRLKCTYAVVKVPVASSTMQSLTQRLFLACLEGRRVRVLRGR